MQTENNQFDSKLKGSNGNFYPINVFDKQQKKGNYTHRQPSSTLVEKSTYNSSQTQTATVQSHRNHRPTSNYNTKNPIKINTNKIISDLEKNKFEDYRFMLNQDLLEVLSKERESESKRDRLLANCCNLDERDKFNKIFAIERKEATLKIIKINEYVL